MINLSLLSLMSARAHGEPTVQCQQSILEQWDAFYAIYNAVSQECQRQNSVLSEQGFPSCVELCSEKAIKELAAPSTEVSVRIGNSTMGSSPYGSMYGMGGSMGGMGGTGSINSASNGATSTASANNFLASSSDKLIISFEVRLKYPLAPTVRVECTNPLNSPIVQTFASTILSSPWAQNKYKAACGT